MIFTRARAGRLWLWAAMFAAFTALGCQPGNSFPCGTGTCDRATQVCLIGGTDKCSTCVSRPAACDAAATCACLPPATDPSFEPFQCDDEGTCAEEEGGLVVTCSEPRWICG